MSKFSNFPLYRPESDLYLLDIRTNEWSKAEPIPTVIGRRATTPGPATDTGRSIAASVKTGCVLTCTSAILMPRAISAKPFLLPQREPEYHEKIPIVYNVPEFVKGPVAIRPQRLIEAAWSRQVVKARLDPNVGKRSEAQPIDTSYPSFHGN